MNRTTVFKFTLVFALLGTLFFSSCMNEANMTELSILKMIEEAPDAGPVNCTKKGVEGYNFSFSSWRDSADIKYYVVNTPPLMEKAEADSVIQRAYGLWNQEINIPIEQTNNIDEADIVIEFEFLDGKNGTLGLSEFPPSSADTPTPIKVLFDSYDIHGAVEVAAVYDFFTIAVHECGHSLGLRHSGNLKAVMYPTYNQALTELAIDDVLGIRTRYMPGQPFYFEDHEYVWINKDSEFQILPNFKEKEFFTRCNTELDGHFLCRGALDGIDLIRNEYGTPIKVLSSFRDEYCNHRVGGASQSQHVVHNAVDWKFVGPNARNAYNAYVNDVINQNCTFTNLLVMGVRGLGAYPTSFHIDTRLSGAKHFGPFSYSTWGVFTPGAITEDREAIESSFLEHSTTEWSLEQ